MAGLVSPDPTRPSVRPPSLPTIKPLRSSCVRPWGGGGSLLLARCQPRDVAGWGNARTLTDSPGR